MTEYQKFAKLALDPRNRPLSFSCAAGKDRTGWAAVILYMLLGVSREKIVEDYAVSATLLEPWGKEIVFKVRGHVAKLHPGKKVDLEPFKKLLTVEPEWLAGGFAKIDEKWGSVDGYLCQGLGVSDAQWRDFQERMLEPATDG